MITPMKYITILCMREDREAVLAGLQKCGEVMLCPPSEGERSVQAPVYDAAGVEKLIRDLKRYEQKKSFLAGLPEIGMEEFEQTGMEAESAVKELQALIDDIEAGKTARQEKEALRETLKPWEALTVSAEELGESLYTMSVLGEIALRNLEDCLKAAKENGFGLEILSQDQSKAYAAAFYLKEETIAPLVAAGFEKITLPPVSGRIGEAIRRLEAEIAQLSKLEEERKRHLMELAGSAAPKLIYEKYHTANERNAAPAAETAMTAYVEGWVPADRTSAVERAVAEAAGVYDISYRDPLPDEIPPTVLRNSRAVRQFEGITEMFTAPKYGEVDPNPVMAPWYWVIFGLMMGDAGYGLLMACAVLLLKKLMKPRGNTEKLMNVILYSSVTTMIFGVLFGSYFGETWHPILFNPLDDPVKMLILTLVVGGLHIFTGMIVKAWMNIKAGQFWSAVFDQFSWMLILSGAGLIFISQTRIVGIALAAAGAVVVLLTAVRAKKGVFGKITGGLVGLYGVTNYMSDILSYSRILALSLATGVVGMVMNMLAGMVRGSIPVLGFLFALLIYAVGHVFNLALSLLSAYVHDCRLQYIEFYGKFFDGGGKIFKPFSIQTKYIQLKEHDNGGK